MWINIHALKSRCETKVQERIKISEPAEEENFLPSSVPSISIAISATSLVIRTGIVKYG